MAKRMTPDQIKALMGLYEKANSEAEWDGVLQALQKKGYEKRDVMGALYFAGGKSVPAPGSVARQVSDSPVGQSMRAAGRGLVSGLSGLTVPAGDEPTPLSVNVPGLGNVSPERGVGMAAGMMASPVTGALGAVSRVAAPASAAMQGGIQAGLLTGLVAASQAARGEEVDPNDLAVAAALSIVTGGAIGKAAEGLSPMVRLGYRKLADKLDSLPQGISKQLDALKQTPLVQQLAERYRAATFEGGPAAYAEAQRYGGVVRAANRAAQENPLPPMTPPQTSGGALVPTAPRPQATAPLPSMDVQPPPPAPRALPPPPTEVAPVGPPQYGTVSQYGTTPSAQQTPGPMTGTRVPGERVAPGSLGRPPVTPQGPLVNRPMAEGAVSQPSPIWPSRSTQAVQPPGTEPIPAGGTPSLGNVTTGQAVNLNQLGKGSQFITAAGRSYEALGRPFKGKVPVRDLETGQVAEIAAFQDVKPFRVIGAMEQGARTPGTGLSAFFGTP